MSDHLLPIINDVKEKNPGREIVHIPMADKVNGENFDLICVLPNKGELLLYLKDSTSDDVNTIHLARERLACMCVRSPDAKQLADILERRPFMAISICRELQKFSGINSGGEAKKV